MTTFALGIPHCSWKPERVEALNRLLQQLAAADVPEGPSHRGPTRIFADKEPNWSWAQKLWLWGYETGASHLLQLQDDVQVGAEFWTALLAMVAAVPDQVIGLESVLALGSPWYTTGDGLIGVGYVLPRTVLAELFAWEASRLRPGAIESLNEDQLLGLFCFETGRRIWHPNPTIIDHDLDIPSTYGNDAHTHRRPAASTVAGATLPLSWRPSEATPHVGSFYRGSTPALLRHWCRGYSYKRMTEDLRK